MGGSIAPMCRSACQPPLKPYPPENLSVMTAKKKVSSSTKPKPAKSKAVVAKAPAKKTAKSLPSPKKNAVKKPAKTKEPAVAKSAKPKKSKTGVSKAPVKKPTPKVAPKSTKVKSKPSVKKEASKKSPAKTKDSSTISKVKEIVSKSLGKSQSEVKKVESNSFSFEDVLGFLKSKKKDKPKAGTTQGNASSQVAKVGKVKEKKASKVKKITTASIDDILGFGAPVVGTIRPVRDEAKVPKQWLTYYHALMSLRTALKGSLGERSSETIGASARESGELSINSSDAGTETFDRDLALSMVANDQEALEEIEDAIDRIFAGTYGVCLETKKPINKNRLKAVPFTRFSVEGQIEFERGKIKDRDLGAGSFATLADSTMGEEE